MTWRCIYSEIRQSILYTCHDEMSLFIWHITYTPIVATQLVLSDTSIEIKETYTPPICCSWHYTHIIPRRYLRKFVCFVKTATLIMRNVCITYYVIIPIYCYIIYRDIYIYYTECSMFCYYAIIWYIYTVQQCILENSLLPPSSSAEKLQNIFI